MGSAGTTGTGFPSPLPSPGGSVRRAQEQATSKSFHAQVWDWLACFRSIHLAIVLLSLLAIGTFIGVMMPQEGLVDIFEIKQRFGPNYRIFKALGLFNVFSCYWFLAIEVLFFFNLLFGSFQWLRPAFNSAVNRTFRGAEHIEASSKKFTLNSALTEEETLSAVQKLLQKRRYGVYADASHPERLYATKGNFSRLGPCIAHFGILLLLVASVLGAFTGFKAQKLAAPGSSFTLADVEFFSPNIDTRFWQGEVPAWKIHVNSFKVDYYANRPDTPKQYYADLSVFHPDGRLEKRETISVNHPLTLGPLTLYQASYAPTGKLFLEINGQKTTVEADQKFGERPISVTPLDKFGHPGLSLVTFPFFVKQDPGTTDNHLRAFLQDQKGFVGSAPGKMPENLRLTEGQDGRLKNLHIKYIEPEIATGLQIKQAPEVPWIYLSFGIIMIGAVMCIFSQRQLWAAVVKKAEGGYEVLFSYQTNKARLSFLKELVSLEKDLEQTLTDGGQKK